MAFEDDMIEAGCIRVAKKRFFVEIDESGEIIEGGEVQESQQTDCNGDPINPHVLIPPGKVLRCHNEDTRTAIDRKIKNKETPERYEITR